MYALLAAKNRGIQAEALGFARELIRTPSPTHNERDVARLVEDRMHKLGYDRVLSDEFGNVVGVLFGRQGHPSVMLARTWTRSRSGR